MFASSDDRKRRRSILACDTCRLSKIRCLNDNDMEKKCERCTRQGIFCNYSPKLSQLRKKSIAKIKSFERIASYTATDTNNGKQRCYNGSSLQQSGIGGSKLTLPKKHNQSSNELCRTLVPPQQAGYDKGGYIKVIMPSRQMIIGVMEIFFKNQYQGIFPFIHKPSFQAFIRSKDFDPEKYMDNYGGNFEEEPPRYASSLCAPDPVVLLAILALCARLHPELVDRYGSFDESVQPQFFKPGLAEVDSTHQRDKSASNASKYFAWHARNRLKDVFDSPTIQRVQAFTMLSSHEWGEINAGRSFSYIGLAARMALMLGMGSPNGICYKDSDEPVSKFAGPFYSGKDKEKWEFIILESKRRTLWSVYMMDRCISSGRNRSPAVKIEDINIPVPCSEQSFTFGDPDVMPSYKELLRKVESLNTDLGLHANDPKKELSKCSSYAFTILSFELWASIGKWVGEVGSREENFKPWLESSESFKFSKRLDMIEESLPPHLKFNMANMNAHMAGNTAGLYGYLHSLLFISRIFINRENFYCRPDQLPNGWWQNSTEKLFAAIRSSTVLFDTLSTANLMVVAPFTGFEVFTNAGTCLYFDTFPRKVLEQFLPIASSPVFPIYSLDFLKEEFRKLSCENIRFLQKWAKVWSLCKLWLNWALQMETMPKYLDELKLNDSIKKQSLRLALRDYGQNEIVEDNDYVNRDSDQLKKTKLLKNVLGAEEAVSIISLLNGKICSDSQDTSDSQTSDTGASENEVVHYRPVTRNLADLEFLENADLNYYLQGWYDVLNSENTLEPPS